MKFPINNLERAERTFTCDRPQLNQSMHNTLKQSPPTAINMFQTTQRRDYTKSTPIPEEHLILETITGLKSRATQQSTPSNSDSCHKHLDIYMPTTMRDFVPYSAEKQHGISEKDYITVWDWLETPKSNWGYGLKEHPTLRKEWLGEPLYDREQFRQPIMERTVRNIPKFVKNAGLSSEMRLKYRVPEEQTFLMVYQSVNAIPIPPTDLRTPTTEYSMYGSGRRIQEVIDASKKPKIVL